MTANVIKQPQNRLWLRYQQYLANTSDKYPKSFEEWLNS